MTSHPIKSSATWALLLICALLLLAACAAGPNELVDTGRILPAFGWAYGRG
jgi:hypothetical protein